MRGIVLVLKDRYKLSVDDQINHMKDLGITFDIMNEDKAKEFLTYNTYYFKLKSYAKNYGKYDRGEHVGKYINLDFIYLVDLSRIDLHLSRLILKLTLDIEHSLKVGLMRDITNNPHEDGYSIVKDFLNTPNYCYICNNLAHKQTGSTCSNLIKKYDPDYPIWVLIECLSFGDFICLYEYYYNKYEITEPDILDFLWSARFLRNSAAHSNCLINSLKTPYKNSKKRTNGSTKTAVTYLSKMADIHPESRRKKMANPVINDFIATLLLYDLVVKSEGMKKNRILELNYFLKNRAIRNKEYYVNNPFIKSTYDFIKIFFNNKFPEIASKIIDK